MTLPVYNILLVEDSFIDAECEKRALSQVLDGDSMIHHVATMEQAEAYLRGDTAYDIVLLDLGLPDTEDRVDTFVRLDRAKNPDVPVLIVTGFQQQELAQKMLAFGAQDYLTKAQIINRPETVRTAIDYAIRRHRSFSEKLSVAKAGDSDAEELMRYISGTYPA